MGDKIRGDETLDGTQLKPVRPTNALSLVIMSPSGTRYVVLPALGTVTLGRSAECEVCIDDGRLSRKHAAIRCGAEISVVDLGSRNGTHLHDERLPPNVRTPLRAGDSIVLGEGVVVLLRRAEAKVDGAQERSAAPSGAIGRMEQMLLRVAAGSINVLVLGETGVGKEILSRRIHTLSPRASMPLVSLNCAALSESLLESELFGHEKGAFTGALQAKEGLLESAGGGTVFLDEIGEMPASVQAKLLRVIEQREVTRVGALRPRAIDVRFVSATHRDLEAEIAAGRFRQDLYFRLNGVALAIPPLRERVDEIEPLAKAFAEEACRTMQRGRPPRIADEALGILKAYAWPGNIRELRNVIERAVLLCSGGLITHEHLPMEKLAPVRRPPALVTMRPPVPVAPAAPGDAPWEGADDIESVTMETTLPAAGDIERLQVLAALARCRGNQSKAAKELGMSRQTFIRRLEEYAIARPRKRE